MLLSVELELVGMAGLLLLRLQDGDGERAGLYAGTVRDESGPVERVLLAGALGGGLELPRARCALGGGLSMQGGILLRRWAAAVLCERTR